MRVHVNTSRAHRLEGVHLKDAAADGGRDLTANQTARELAHGAHNYGLPHGQRLGSDRGTKRVGNVLGACSHVHTTRSPRGEQCSLRCPVMGPTTDATQN